MNGKHEKNSCLLVLVLFVPYILIGCSAFVLDTYATASLTQLFVYLLTAPENLVEHSYQALYYRFNQHLVHFIKHGSKKLWLFV